MFGLSYTPFRVTALLWFLAVPTLWYVTTRRASPLLSLAGVVALLAVPTFEIHPATFNHYVVAVGAIVCGWALRRERPERVVVGVTLALSGAAGGVAVGVACIVHGVCSASPRRAVWAAVLIPLAVWGLWWSFRSELLLRAQGDDRVAGCRVREEPRPLPVRPVATRPSACGRVRRRRCPCCGRESVRRPAGSPGPRRWPPGPSASHHSVAVSARSTCSAATSSSPWSSSCSRSSHRSLSTSTVTGRSPLGSALRPPLRVR